MRSRRQAGQRRGGGSAAPNELAWSCCCLTVHTKGAVVYGHTPRELPKHRSGRSAAAGVLEFNASVFSSAVAAAVEASCTCRVSSFSRWRDLSRHILPFSNTASIMSISQSLLQSSSFKWCPRSQQPRCRRPCRPHAHTAAAALMPTLRTRPRETRSKEERRAKTYMTACASSCLL